MFLFKKINKFKEDDMINLEDSDHWNDYVENEKLSNDNNHKVDSDY